MFKRKNNEKGFTLIELMIVVAIIGILGSIVMGKLGGSRDKAAGTATVAQAKAVAQVLQQYRADNNAYPTTLAQLTDGTAPNGKVYADPIRPVIGDTVTMSKKPYDASTAGGAANPPLSYVLTYTGVTGQEAIEADLAADGSKTPTTGLVQVTGAAEPYTVDILVTTAAAY